MTPRLRAEWATLSEELCIMQSSGMMRVKNRADVGSAESEIHTPGI